MFEEVIERNTFLQTYIPNMEDTAKNGYMNLRKIGKAETWGRQAMDRK